MPCFHETDTVCVHLLTTNGDDGHTRLTTRASSEEAAPSTPGEPCRDQNPAPHPAQGGRRRSRPRPQRHLPRRLRRQRRRGRRRRRRRRRLGRRQDHRPAAAGVEDHALRGLRQAALRGGRRGAVRRLHGRLLQRRPGRGQAGPADDDRARTRARRSSCSTRSTAPARPAWSRRRRARTSRSSPTTASSRTPTTTCPSTTRPSASCRARALVEAMGGEGAILMLNGAPSDPNAAQFKAGAHGVLDGTADILEEYDNPDWSPENAQQWTSDQLSKYDPVGDPGRLRRQRRPGRRRGRGPDRCGCRARRAAPDHRPGRRGRRDPADPRG